MTDSFIWNDKTDILVALSDDRIYTWYYPNAVYIDRDLQELIKDTKVKNSIQIFYHLASELMIGKL